MSQFTKLAIIQAFIKLLNENPIDKITVKDIVNECGVNRNTFYYYYQDIYALLEDIIDSELKKALAITNDFETWQEGFIIVADFALKNKRAIFHIRNSLKRDNLEKYLNDIVEKQLIQYVDKQALNIDVPPKRKDFVVHFYKYAIVGFIDDWIDSGMNTDIEKMISNISAVMSGSVRMLLEKAAFNP